MKVRNPPSKLREIWENKLSFCLQTWDSVRLINLLFIVVQQIPKAKSEFICLTNTIISRVKFSSPKQNSLSKTH